jgi:CRP-like cAMP-binding protein
MVGWSALLGEQGKMTASAIAVEDTELVVVQAERLRRLCEVSHDFGFHLMRSMASALAKRLLATRLQLLDLFADAAPAIPANTVEGRE